MRNFLFFYAFIFKIVSSTGKLADKEKLIRFDEVASVIKLWGSVGSGRCWFVYQIYPPTIDTLVTGMDKGTNDNGRDDILHLRSGHF